jgi:Fe-S oxidoreductase
MDVLPTTEYCRYCLMCRHVCPVGHVTRLETLTPHGWGLTIASVKRGLLAWDEETVNVLYSCADCGLCRANCATDQPLPDAIASARAEVTAQQLAPAIVYEIGEMLDQYENPYVKKTPEKVTGTGAVALFVGDEAAHLWSEGMIAARTLIQATGVTPIEVGIGRNNSYLASSLGFPDTARILAQATLDELRTSGARKLLVLSPGDYFAFNQHLIERLGLTWPEEVELIELTTYLHDLFSAGSLTFIPLETTTPYAYVDPAHAARVPAGRAAARAILKTVLPVPGRELFWRGERAHPAGATALQFTQPHIADDLTFAKLDDMVKSGAQVAITEDAGTLYQLNRHAGRFGVRIQGLYELLAEQLSKSPNQ